MIAWNSMALTFRSKLVRDQLFSPKVTWSRTRLEKKLAALAWNYCEKRDWGLLPRSLSQEVGPRAHCGVKSWPMC